MLLSNLHQPLTKNPTWAPHIESRSLTGCGDRMQCPSLLVVTALGIYISWNDAHLQNAVEPISHLWISLYAPSFINLSAWGIKISCSDVHSANAPSPLSSLAITQSHTWQLRAPTECPILNHLDGRMDIGIGQITWKFQDHGSMRFRRTSTLPPYLPEWWWGGLLVINFFHPHTWSTTGANRCR